MHPNTKRAAKRRYEEYRSKLESFWRDPQKCTYPAELPSVYWAILGRRQAAYLRQARDAAWAIVKGLDEIQYALEELDDMD